MHEVSLDLTQDRPLQDTPSDGNLVRQYSEQRDQQAFEALLKRHGGLVWSIALRLLRNRADAEDAFQATFLVLARRAASLRKVESIAAWLHGVTVRVCQNQMRIERRRQRRIQEAAAMVRRDVDSQQQASLRMVVDEVLASLPVRYREVLVMCDIEGFTIDEIATKLSMTRGAVASRLSRGRERLRKRLVCRGTVIASGGALLAVAHAEAATEVPATLLAATAQNADIYAWGTATTKACLSQHVTQLAEGVIRTMMIAKFKTAICVLLLMGISLFCGFDSFGNRHAAFAGNIFKDDFSDGSITDGAPVTWTPLLEGWPATRYEVANGNLRVSTTSPGEVAVLAALDHVAADSSIRARVRIASNVDEGALIFLRGGNNKSVALELGAHGGLWLGQSDVYEFLTDTDLDPRAEDVVFQLDAIGNNLSIWAWRASEAMPAAPLAVRATSVDAAGAPGIIYARDEDSPRPESTGSATFRYVQFADRHIVAEPSGSMLCAIGSGMLGIVLLVQRRSVRSVAV